MALPMSEVAGITAAELSETDPALHIDSADIERFSAGNADTRKIFASRAASDVENCGSFGTLTFGENFGPVKPCA